MGIALEHGDASSLVRLEGVVDISCAAELKVHLIAALEKGTDVRVSLEGTTDLDVTAIELLWAAAREARASGVGFALAGQAPEALLAALAASGFFEFPVPPSSL